MECYCMGVQMGCGMGQRLSRGNGGRKKATMVHHTGRNLQENLSTKGKPVADVRLEHWWGVRGQKLSYA